MSLEMKRCCERCGKRIFKKSEEVYICSYESTYCEDCAKEKNFKCPHCEGKLEIRPSRIITEIKALPLDNVEEIIFFDDMGRLMNKLQLNNANSNFLHKRI